MNKDNIDILKIAREVIDIEVQGLTALSKALDENFVKLAQAVINIKGRVIVTGMGKSGHIGKKIAASLASTGTLSYFIHPAEASHGDLGMVTKDDIVIALSNSGETRELKDFISYCKRFEITLVGVTRKAKSSLSSLADISIIIPDTKEAAEAVNAPTTSTTQMLALGDALTVTLLTMKGFNKEHFGVFHPGGKLGSQLAKVSQYMHKDASLPICYDSTPMSLTLLEMSNKSFGCIAVLDSNNKVIGIITDGDLRRHMKPDLLTKTAAEIMSPNPITISSDMLMGEALNLINSRGITALMVASPDKTLEGIIHIHDFLRAGTV